MYQRGKAIIGPDGSLLGTGAKVPGVTGLPLASNESRRLFEAWSKSRKNGAIPVLADWDDGLVADLAPSILVADVLTDQHDYRYRRVGAREIEVRGYDPTGKTIRECYGDEVLAFALENYDLAVAHPNGIIDFSIEVVRDHRFIELETLLLPMSDDGTTVSHVLVYSHYLQR